MEILAVIPARGGSKAVPKKNIRDLGGKPLIAHTIEQALQCRMLTDVVVSSDDEQIRDVSMALGARAPFVRPAELSTDTALALPTIQHAVVEMEKLDAKTYDYVIMLQATSPFRKIEDIEKALTMMIESKADAVISVVNVEGWHPMKMKRFDGDKLVDYQRPPIENPPRQILPPVYMMNGAIFATKRDVMMNRNTFQGDYCVGYIMPRERSFDIDDEYDFLFAELLLSRDQRYNAR